MKNTALMPLRWFFLLGFCLLGLPGFSQSGKPLPAGYLQWSASRRLQVADFQLRMRPQNNLHQSVANIGLEINARTYELFGKQANKAVQNVFSTSGSYLDTTGRADVDVQLRYMQTLWDIYEVAARQLRKELRTNARRMVLVGKPDPYELFRTAQETVNKRQIQYADETKYGLFLDKQAAWEQQIASELDALALYALPD